MREPLDSVDRWVRRCESLEESGQMASVFAYCCVKGLAGWCSEHPKPIPADELMRAHGLEEFTEGSIEATPQQVQAVAAGALTGRSLA